MYDMQSSIFNYGVFIFMYYVWLNISKKFKKSNFLFL